MVGRRAASSTSRTRWRPSCATRTAPAAGCPRRRWTLLVQGLRAIEQRVARWRRGGAGRRRAPEALLEALDGARHGCDRGGAGAARRPGAAEPEISRASSTASEREQLRGARAPAARRARRLRPVAGARSARGSPSPPCASAWRGSARSSRWSRSSRPRSEPAPGGLAFALLRGHRRQRRRAREAAGAGARRPCSGWRRRAGRSPRTGADAPGTGAGIDEPASDAARRAGVVRVEVARLDDALERLSALVVTPLRGSTAAVAELAATRAPTSRELAQHRPGERPAAARPARAPSCARAWSRSAELLERVPLLVRGLSRTTGKQVRPRDRRRHAPSSTRPSPSASSRPSCTWSATPSITRIEPPEERARARASRARARIRVALLRARRATSSSSPSRTTAAGIDAAALAAARRPRGARAATRRCSSC